MKGPGMLERLAGDEEKRGAREHSTRRLEDGVK